jgi:aminoglycoside/choline kinase family phosphotransferase
MRGLEGALKALGLAPVAFAELAGDASTRRFYRVTLGDRATVVAALYPDELVDSARADHTVQMWGLAHGLPIPRTLGRCETVVVSEDLGDEDLEAAVARRGADVVKLALDALALFQTCVWRDLPTAPFDAPFFRNELAVFERYALDGGTASDAEVGGFLDALAERLAAHPFRLVHRDFHLNNLLLSGGRVWAVDYQDMRGGPDTYDLASLLRERGGTALPDEAGTVAREAARLQWSPGWQRRYLECAAQRGLKVIGTFLRLAAGGRPEYLRWLPEVRTRAQAALEALGAPEKLRHGAAGGRGGRAL